MLLTGSGGFVRISASKINRCGSLLYFFTIDVYWVYFSSRVSYNFDEIYQKGAGESSSADRTREFIFAPATTQPP